MGIIAKRSVANSAWINQHEPADPVDQIYWERLKVLNYDFLKRDPESIASTALRFTLSVPGVDILLIGTTNSKHLQHNLAQMEAGPLTRSQYNAIHNRWKTLTWWLQLRPNMNSNNPTAEAIESHITPTNFFHDSFKCRRIWESRE